MTVRKTFTLDSSFVGGGYLLRRRSNNYLAWPGLTEYVIIRIRIRIDLLTNSSTDCMNVEHDVSVMLYRKLCIL